MHKFITLKYETIKKYTQYFKLKLSDSKVHSLNYLLFSENQENVIQELSRFKSILGGQMLIQFLDLSLKRRVLHYKCIILGSLSFILPRKIHFFSLANKCTQCKKQLFSDFSIS